MDTQFLMRYREGDEAAFQELFSRYRKVLYTLLWRYLGRHDLVEDVLQETFLQLYLSRTRYDAERPLDPWLFTIAANKAKDALRRSRLRPTVPISELDGHGELAFEDILNTFISDDNGPSEPLEEAEENVRIRHVLASLPKKSREVLTLAYFQHLSYKQIARRLEIPIGTVKSRLHAAVNRFGRKWTAYCERSSVPESAESKKCCMPIRNQCVRS